MDTPKDIVGERIAGGALTGAGGLFLLVHAGSIPGFVIALTIGFGGGGDFWSMLGMSLLLLLGIAMLVHSGRRRRRHVEFVTVREEMRRRHGSHTAESAPAAPMRFPELRFDGDPFTPPARLSAADPALRDDVR